MNRILFVNVDVTSKKYNNKKQKREKRKEGVERAKARTHTRLVGGVVFHIFFPFFL